MTIYNQRDMSRESKWIDSVQKEIQKVKFTRREYRLFAISRFEKSVNWINRFSSQCPVCDKMKPDLLDAAREMKNLSDPAGEKSREFESINDRAYHHLRKEHRLVPPAYYVALNSLLGMVLGAMTGGLVGFLIDSVSDTLKGNWLRNGLLIGWFIGVVAGQISGKRKDNRINQEGRQF